MIFTAEDEVRQMVWVIDDDNIIKQISNFLVK